MSFSGTFQCDLWCFFKFLMISLNVFLSSVSYCFKCRLVAVSYFLKIQLVVSYKGVSYKPILRVAMIAIARCALIQDNRQGRLYCLFLPLGGGVLFSDRGGSYSQWYWTWALELLKPPFLVQNILIPEIYTWSFHNITISDQLLMMQLLVEELWCRTISFVI